MSYPDDNTVRRPQAPGPQVPYAPGPQGAYSEGAVGPYGAAPGPYGAAPGPYGAAPGPYGAAPGPFGAARGPFGGQDPRFQGRVPYQLTREEMHVLNQCKKESFYSRCVPFMTALGLGAYYGVHLGYLKANAKYGASPKVIVGLLVGFIGGKISYRSKCEEKILALPGGRLKEAILSRRKAKEGVLSSFNDGVYSDASLSYAMPYVGGNLQPNEAKSIAELDTDRPYDSFDDSFRSKNFDSEIDQLPTPSPARAVTYDELRLRNREEFENRRKLYRSGPLDDYTTARDDVSSGRLQPPVQPVQPPQARDAAPLYTQLKSAPERKNFYGDVIEK